MEAGFWPEEAGFLAKSRLFWPKEPAYTILKPALLAKRAGFFWPKKPASFGRRSRLFWPKPAPSGPTGLFWPKPAPSGQSRLLLAGKAGFFPAKAGSFGRESRLTPAPCFRWAPRKGAGQSRLSRLLPGQEKSRLWPGKSRLTPSRLLPALARRAGSFGRGPALRAGPVSTSPHGPTSGPLGS